MDQTITITPTVARALEQHRQYIQGGVDELTAVFANDRPSLKDIQKFAASARRLGALDEVCAQHGITEWVSANGGLDG